MELRPYQEEALNQVRKHYAKGTKKVLIQAPTGAGKTLMFCEILKGVIAKKNKAIVIVRGKDLVDQCSKRLFRENVPHGCLQGNHWNQNLTAPIQICSIDTLRRRKLRPDADLIVIDECHYAGSVSFKWFLAQYPDAYLLPVSATPHIKTGLRHIADEVVYSISIQDLMLQGYLSKPSYYAPTDIDLSKVRIDKKSII